MTAIDFPDTPTVGQVFDKWTWNGTAWALTGHERRPVTDFGDSEPEDGWDADDPPRELLGNIARRVLLLRASLDAVATPRERLRFDQISEDLGHVMDRLR